MRVREGTASCEFRKEKAGERVVQIVYFFFFLFNKVCEYYNFKFLRSYQVGLQNQAHRRYVNLFLLNSDECVLVIICKFY